MSKTRQDLQQKPYYKSAELCQLSELKTQEYSSEQTEVLMSSTGYSAGGPAHTATPND